MDRRKMEECLFSKWNDSISAQRARAEMRRLLSGRKPAGLFRDLGRRQRAGGDGKVPRDALIVTCALFCRGQDGEEALASAIRNFHVEDMLFLGLRLFLCNQRQGLCFTIRWTDQRVSNRYDWLCRFSGEFADPAYRELFSTARLLYKIDPQRLWQIALADANDLLLLSWFEIFWEVPPTERALELLTPAQSERRQALAFWWLTAPVRQPDGAEAQAGAVLSELREVPEAVLFPLVYEFLLREREKCPRAFCDYLTKPSRDRLLRAELNRDSRVVGWGEAAAAASLINRVGNARRRSCLLGILLSGVERELESGLMGSGLEKSREFLLQIPPPARRAFQQNLAAKPLHTAGIDRIVRPRVYQRDAMVEAVLKRVLADASEIAD